MSDVDTLPGIGADYGQGFGSNDSLFAVPTSIGLPVDNQSSAPPPGFDSTVSSVQPAPPISTVDKIWGSISSTASSVVSKIEAAPGEALDWTEGEIKSGYNTVKSGVGTVVSDVTSPVTSSLKSVYVYAIVGVIVLAGAIYFIGRGGAIGQAASLKPV